MDERADLTGSLADNKRVTGGSSRITQHDSFPVRSCAWEDDWAEGMQVGKSAVMGPIRVRRVRYVVQAA